MTYAEIAKERDDLKIENETLRAIMDKMLEKGKALEAENAELKARLEKAVELPEKVAERALQIAEELGELCAPRQYYIDKAKRSLRRK